MYFGAGPHFPTLPLPSGVEPSDPVLLVFAHVCGAEQGYVLSQHEFLHGMQELNCSSLEALKQSTAELRARLEDDGSFREVRIKKAR